MSDFAANSARLIVRRLVWLLGSTKERLAANPLKRPCHTHCFSGQVYVFPPQPEGFPQPQSQRKRDREKRSELLLFRSGERPPRFIGAQSDGFVVT